MHVLQEEEALLRSYKGNVEELGVVEHFMLGVRHCPGLHHELGPCMGATSPVNNPMYYQAHQSAMLMVRAPESARGQVTVSLAA